MIQQVADIFRSEDRFVIVTHVNPDGDAVGSLLGLFNALSDMGKTCRPLFNGPFPETYDFLPGRESLITTFPDSEAPPSWIVAVDVAAADRMAGRIEGLRETAKLLVIDHHPTNPGFGNVNLIDPSATSTAELVYRVLVAAGHSPSASTAQCLYAGILTDTGCFRFSGVTAQTLLLASELLRTGFDASAVARQLYEEYPLPRLALERVLLDRLEILLEGKLLLSTLHWADFESIGASLADAENLVNKLRETKGVLAGVLLTELADGAVRASLRSRDHIDASAIAKSLGGGGHRNAAGLKSTLPLGEVKSRIVEAVAKAIAEA